MAKREQPDVSRQNGCAPLRRTDTVRADTRRPDTMRPDTMAAGPMTLNPNVLKGPDLRIQP
ncbi:MAG: hypothetical protein KAY32_07265 [Candidatus Eisenbacteria sp.]|nr:hypothetical protein [Candidatus Eisenbacteria bacterium]